MRRCMVCCAPLPHTTPLGRSKHDGCSERAVPVSRSAPKEQKPRFRKRDTIGAQILRAAQGLAGSEWEGADNARRLQWKREAKVLIFSQFRSHV